MTSPTAIEYRNAFYRMSISQLEIKFTGFKSGRDAKCTRKTCRLTLCRTITKKQLIPSLLQHSCKWLTQLLIVYYLKPSTHNIAQNKINCRI